MHIFPLREIFMWKVFFTRAFLSQSGAAMKSSTNPSVRSRGRGHLRCSADARITDMATILGLLGAGPRPDCPYKHSCSLFFLNLDPLKFNSWGKKSFVISLKIDATLRVIASLVTLRKVQQGCQCCAPTSCPPVL